MREGKLGAGVEDEFFLIPDHAGMPFEQAMEALHRHFRPGTYLQIGGADSGMLRLASCPTLAVQEQFTIGADMLGSKPACLFMQMPSDRFFADYDPAALLNGPIDLAVLGGARRFEALLRELINTERYCRRESIIVLRDCLPTDAHSARREAADTRFERRSPHPEWWAGDGWKLVAVLKRYRPDLRLLALDAKPAGLMAVTDLDPASGVLSKQYFALTDQFRSAYLTQTGAEAFMRALNMTDSTVLEDAAACATLFGQAPRAPTERPRNAASAVAQAVPKQADGPITLYRLRQITGPVQGLEDIWERLHALLLHWRLFNADEAKLRTQQHGMVRDGCFLMPSPFAEQPDRCTESYYVPHRFCYRFRASEDYFWISGPLDDAFALSTIFFPKRRIAVCLADRGTDESDLLELEKMCADAAKPAAAAADSRQGKRVVVTGHSHYMHTLWNELPALERAAAAGLADSISLAAAYQPLGPLAELFPEFARDLRPLSFHEISALNREHRLPVGLGSRTISTGVQQRLRAVADRHADAAVLARRDCFRAAHSPIFWFSVKPLGRTCLRQAAVLAHLIAATKQAYPSAGFILNGTSRPWDLERNENYGSWFADGLQPASAQSRQTIAEVISRLPQAMHACVQAISDVSVCEEIAWGGAADFYFCHGGTMQNKIGWIHRIPGMVHSSRQFMQVWKSNAHVVEDAPPCYFVSSEIIVDGIPESYAAFTRERTVANYDFTSLDELAREFLEAVRESLPAADRLAVNLAGGADSH